MGLFSRITGKGGPLGFGILPKVKENIQEGKGPLGLGILPAITGNTPQGNGGADSSGFDYDEGQLEELLLLCLQMNMMQSSMLFGSGQQSSSGTVQF